MSKYYLRNGNLARQFGVLDPVTHLPYSSLFVIGTVLTPPPHPAESNDTHTVLPSVADTVGVVQACRVSCVGGLWPNKSSAILSLVRDSLKKQPKSAA